MAEMATLKRLIESKDKEIARLNEKLVGEQHMQIERQQLENEIKLLKSLTKDVQRENTELRKNLADYDSRDDQYTTIHDLSLCKDQEIMTLKKEIRAMQKMLSEKDKALQGDKDQKSNKLAVEVRLLQAETGQLKAQKKQLEKQYQKAKQTITAMETRLHYITVALKRCGKDLFTDAEETTPPSPNGTRRRTPERPQWCGPKDCIRRSSSASGVRKPTDFLPLPIDEQSLDPDTNTDVVPIQLYSVLQADYARALKEMEEIKDSSNKTHTAEVARLHEEIRKLDLRYKKDLSRLKAELGVETSAVGWRN